jgi:DNA processing protein
VSGQSSPGLPGAEREQLSLAAQAAGRDGSGVGPSTAAQSDGAVTVCPDCRRRTALLAALNGLLDHRRYDRSRLLALLALSDRDLAMAAGALGRRGADPPSRQRAGEELARRLAEAESEIAATSGWGVCRHHPAYPDALRGTPAPPAVIHVHGDPRRVLGLLAGPCVAVVGARHSSPYGDDVARSLGRGLAAARVTVVSGLAQGIDSAAHHGALEVGGPTIAVMAGGADLPYPPSRARLHQRLLEGGGAVSEMPFGLVARRWSFQARNRVIAGLSALTVVVEANERSGSLITAAVSQDLGREVGAVPGPVTSAVSRGTNQLLKDGAAVVTEAQDVLDLLFGVGVRAAASRPEVTDRDLRILLDAVGRGLGTVDALVGSGLEPEAVTTGIAEL